VLLLLLLARLAPQPLHPADNQMACSGWQAVLRQVLPAASAEQKFLHLVFIKAIQQHVACHLEKNH